MDSSPRPTRRGHYIQWIVNFGDILVLNTVFMLTMLIFPALYSNSQIFRELWVMVNVSWMPVLVWASDHEHERRAVSLDRVMRSSLMAVILHAMVFLSLIVFLHIPDIANRALLSFYGMLVIGIPLFRILSGYLIKSYRRRGYNFTRVVIVGTGPTAVRLASGLEKDAGFGYRILGFFDYERPADFEGGNFYSLDDLPEFVRKKRVDQIFFTLSGQDPALQSVIRTADKNIAEFYYVPQVPRTFRRPLELHTIGSVPVMSIRPNPLKSLTNRILKRSFDLAVSSVFLLFYPLVYIPIAIAIKTGSPGPVYFRQERTGLRGRSFTCLKFRTMRLNTQSDSCQATANDPRKTRLGDFLRRTSLDELPQFINVWRGDMSLVGPRPHMLKHTEEYTRLIDRYMVRHAVKPGITGWAQVNGYRGLTDELWKMERRVEHDVWYIENWTFLLDLKIMVRTVMNAVAGEKNAF
ncbi:MAG: undecaprenyl-phosphate glucose phosphotransferase [Muribaculaceae bacterium]|nr:undecaprenyl-phosphate glucose phosphotransferase [Muribaculaceae bacterium]